MNSTLAPIACVVTETTWDRTDNRDAIARQRKNAGRRKIENPIEPVTHEVTYRTGHLSNDCPRIRDARTEVVSLDVPLDTADAGLPCETCAVPNLHLVRDRAEVAPVAVEGTGDPYLDNTDDNPHVIVTPPASPNAPSIKQVEFLTSLLHDAFTLRGMSALHADQATAEAIQRMHDRGEWTKRHVSARIDKGVEVCKQLRAEQAAAPVAPAAPLAEVVAGYYALDGSEHATNTAVFYAVDRPTEGKYAGRTFVKQIIGGSRGDRVGRAQVPAVLARILAVGIAESQARYGREIGRCGVCNRTLTDDESRRLGIGPVCRKGGRD